MDDKSQQQLLNDVLHAMFGDSFKGKYMVEIKMSTMLDADNLKDAKTKGLEYAKNNPDKWNAYAIKIDDIVEKINR